MPGFEALFSPQNISSPREASHIAMYILFGGVPSGAHLPFRKLCPVLVLCDLQHQSFLESFISLSVTCLLTYSPYSFFFFWFTIFPQCPLQFLAHWMGSKTTDWIDVLFLFWSTRLIIYSSFNPNWKERSSWVQETNVILIFNDK